MILEQSWQWWELTGWIDVPYMFAMPFREVVIKPRWAIKLCDLTGADAIKSKCLLCDKVRITYPQKLHQKYQCFESIRTIQQGFHCTCGSNACTLEIIRYWNGEGKFPELKAEYEGDTD